MPVYNAGKYIFESINSVLKQSFGDLEFIIVDDGSTDQTIDIINCFSDDRIKLIKKDHDYIASLNLGIRSSTGKYIARMDADDIMMPDKIEIQYNYMEANPEIDVCGTFVYFYAGNQLREYTYFEKHDDIILSMILKCSICHPSVMMRRSSLEEKADINCLYDSEYIYAEDYKLWIELIKKGFVFSILPEFLLKYRISADQVTCTKNEKMKQKASLVQMDYLYYMASQFIDENPDYFEIIDKFIDLFNKKEISFMNLRHVITGILRNHKIGSEKVEDSSPSTPTCYH